LVRNELKKILFNFYFILFYFSLASTGMKDGQQIRFSGEGDQEPGLEPGDIVIVLDEKEHPQFRRRGMDLITQKELQLVEALCGFQKTIKTLDNRSLIITCLPGKTGFGLQFSSPSHSSSFIFHFRGLACIFLHPLNVCRALACICLLQFYMLCTRTASAVHT
jgi:hypothetical protein